jgi:hypothetical protein
MAKNKNEFPIPLVGVIFCIMISLIIGHWVGYLASRGLCDCKVTIETNIPSRDMIMNFCKSKGFDAGWLDSWSCGENEVQCEQKITLADKKLVNYECVKWMK